MLNRRNHCQLAAWPTIVGVRERRLRTVSFAATSDPFVPMSREDIRVVLQGAGSCDRTLPLKNCRLPISSDARTPSATGV
jgi:hypothetical protein